MKFTIFLSAWLIALAINPSAIGPKYVGVVIIALMLMFVDLAGWSERNSKQK